jgi:hypothetical protein
MREPVAEHRGCRVSAGLGSQAFSSDSTGHLRSRESDAGTVGRMGSRLIMLARHPRPDVRGTIAKDNTSSSFVLSQETDGVTIGEDQVRKIQDKDTAGRLCID